MTKKKEKNEGEAQQELTLEEIHLALREFIHCAVRWQDKKKNPELTYSIPRAFDSAVVTLAKAGRLREQRLELINAAYAYHDLHEAVLQYCERASKTMTDAQRHELRKESALQFVGLAKQLPLRLRRHITIAWSLRLVDRLSSRSNLKDRERAVRAALRELEELVPEDARPPWDQVTYLARTIDKEEGKAGSAMATDEERESMEDFAVWASWNEMLGLVFEALNFPFYARRVALAEACHAQDQAMARSAERSVQFLRTAFDALDS